jgi:hypothetical protein
MELQNTSRQGTLTSRITAEAGKLGHLLLVQGKRLQEADKALQHHHGMEVCAALLQCYTQFP